MSYLASDVMEQARAILNDTAITLYNNTALLPYVKRANLDLEKTLNIYGASVERMKSAAIPVAANATTLTLPADFLLPTWLKERASGNTNDPWVDMTEKDVEPDNYTPSTILGYWSFRNNGIYFPGCTVARDVLLQYDRQLAIITGDNSPEDFLSAQAYLASRTAELAARYIGQNKMIADDIAIREVAKSEDDLMHMYVLNGQGIQKRRKRFTTRTGVGSNVYVR